jgi:anaerobic selenocysteine-containing dehydrogenase
VVPAYTGIQDLADTGDAVQWGGRHLCSGGDFPTPTGRGAFSALRSSSTEVPDGMYTVATRRGKQFNSMVFKPVDPLTGAARDAVYMDAADAASVGLRDGDAVRLVNGTGSFEGHLKLTRLPHRTLQVHWPEGNVLLPSGPENREPGSNVPDYNALVTLERR